MTHVQNEKEKKIRIDIYLPLEQGDIWPTVSYALPSAPLLDRLIRAGTNLNQVRLAGPGHRGHVALPHSAKQSKWLDMIEKGNELAKRGNQVYNPRDSIIYKVRQDMGPKHTGRVIFTGRIIKINKNDLLNK